MQVNANKKDEIFFRLTAFKNISCKFARLNAVALVLKIILLVNSALLMWVEFMIRWLVSNYFHLHSMKGKSSRNCEGKTCYQTKRHLSSSNSTACWCNRWAQLDIVFIRDDRLSRFCMSVLCKIDKMFFC